MRAVIDWEFCSSAPAFQYELAAALYIWLRDGVAPEVIGLRLNAILEGYGMSRSEFENGYRDTVEDIILLNSLSTIRKYVLLCKSAALRREPWRRTFALRAQSRVERRSAAGMPGAGKRPLAA